MRGGPLGGVRQVPEGLQNVLDSTRAALDRPQQYVMGMVDNVRKEVQASTRVLAYPYSAHRHPGTHGVRRGALQPHGGQAGGRAGGTSRVS